MTYDEKILEALNKFYDDTERLFGNTTRRTLSPSIYAAFERCTNALARAEYEDTPEGQAELARERAERQARYRQIADECARKDRQLTGQCPGA